MSTEQQTILNEDSLKLFKKNTYKKSHQEFVRDEVLVGQSIDPYQRIVIASKKLLSQKKISNNELEHIADKD